MKYLITGGAGFIGTNLADSLSKKNKVTIVDNLNTGFKRYISKNKNIEFVKCDLLNIKKLKKIFKNHQIIFHLAANADIRFGLKHPRKDLEQNVLATFNVLEAMRMNGAKKIVFSSTGSVYGEPSVFPTPEDAPFPIQTSLYAASKIACESLISAYCEGYGFQSWIFRFVSILGERYTHGHVYDFYKFLKENPKVLPVLGNGMQKKSYLYVQDCLDAILLALSNSNKKINLFNLGVNNYCEVRNSIKWISNYLNLEPKIVYSGGERGWIGDSPFIFLDTKKICSLGWSPKLSIKDGVIATVNYLKSNEWVFEARK